MVLEKARKKSNTQESNKQYQEAMISVEIQSGVF
jgi:hypothetical protein